MSQKTVYILGAGASKTTGLPLQSEILPLIFSIDMTKLGAEKDKSFMDLEIDDRMQRLHEIYPKFDEYRRELGEFIVTNFASVEMAIQYRLAISQAENFPVHAIQRNEYYFKAYNIAKEICVTLEDLFTIFDNVAIGREHFRLYSANHMALVHNRLKQCIIFSLVYSIYSDNCNDSLYSDFAKELIATRLAASQKEDILSVITLNWDDILENCINQMCNEYNSKLKNGQIKIYPDLCFYDYSFDDHHMVSTHIKAKGYKNIKILKMHGSLGWLECPKCGRVFVDYNKDISINEFFNETCPFCTEEPKYKFEENPLLRSMIVTPTFLKELGNLNLKNIWHNTLIDISEADRIIFIGYSFPDADFEMRCLLKKAVKTEANISVILHSSDNPATYSAQLRKSGLSEKESSEFVAKMSLPEVRYKTFFGTEHIKFDYNGLEGYINKMKGDKHDEKR